VVKAVLQICNKAKISISSTKRFTDIHASWKEAEYAEVSYELRQPRKMFCIGIVSDFMTRKNFPLQRNSLLN
jgi:hypothetical protein